MQNNRTQWQQQQKHSTSPHNNFQYGLRSDGSSEFDALHLQKRDVTKNYSFVPRNSRGLVALNDLPRLMKAAVVCEAPKVPDGIDSRVESSRNNNNNNAGSRIDSMDSTTNLRNISKSYSWGETDAPNFDYGIENTNYHSINPGSSTRSYGDTNVSSNHCGPYQNVSNGHNGNTISYGTNGNHVSNNTTTWNRSTTNHISSCHHNSEFDNDQDEELLALDVDQIVSSTVFSKSTSHSSQLVQPLNQSCNNNRSSRVPLRSIGGNHDSMYSENNTHSVSTTNHYCDTGPTSSTTHVSTFGESYDSNIHAGWGGNTNHANSSNNAPPCPGHNVPCRLLTAQTASNQGRQFYKCSLPGE